MLAGNRLTRLPESLGQCHRLELLRIAANRLTELPPFLLALPRLTWLAYAGNPLESEADATALESTPTIPWSELTLEQRLGEGASGVIHQAQWQPAGQPPRAVAVKLYKGEMTSDGSPLHEMNACISAGLHPNLIRVEGRILDHPQGQNGLVMQLIDKSFANLAALPSLDSCSRDIYPDDARFNADVTLGIARGIARWARTCTPRASPMATSMATTPCGTPKATACWGILAQRPSMPRTTPCKAGRCNAWKCGPSASCWKNCWSAGMAR